MAIQESWNDGVRGDEVPRLINSDAQMIRVESGPGTGKTFGLIRRVHRLMHPDGLGVPGSEILVVAFNRVIAKELRAEIASELLGAGISELPKIHTLHALCLRIIEEEMRLLLPHESEAMLYDVLHLYPKIRSRYEKRPYDHTTQALHDHEAGHKEDTELWQAVMQWLDRHNAALISDLPRRVLDRIRGGDFRNHRYRYVIVDEFQDLTSAEQELFFRLRSEDGQFLALGDSRQSIYAFRGNAREGLRRLDEWANKTALNLADLPLRQCQRCPRRIVKAANQLMSLSDAEQMKPGSQEPGDIHVLLWHTPRDEAQGMARKIFNRIRAHPDERHLVMVTRRQFGFWFRDALVNLAPDLDLDLSFEEGILESWAAREAFLFFCLLVDPDPPTWRAWLGYQDPTKKKPPLFKAPNRNAGAYLRLLKESNDLITEEVIEELSKESRTKNRGPGGSNVWDRATRYLSLRDEVGNWRKYTPEEVLQTVFSERFWDMSAEGSEVDLALLREKATQVLEEFEDEQTPEEEWLQVLAQKLRYRVATREPLARDEDADVEVMTLWGAKGITADNVYVLGLCDEAIPGSRRDEYPGTESQYIEEQKRLFYVSLTRAKNTLVLSRAQEIGLIEAKRMGLQVSEKSFGNMADLQMSRFLRDIMSQLPDAMPGDSWDS